MTINKLSEISVKIKLDNDDLKKYHINNFNINSKNIKSFLFEISPEISAILNVDISSSKIYVEVFSYKNSCLIFLSYISDTKPVSYTNKNIICQFENFENLESFCRTLNALYKKSVKSSSLYCNENYIRLILKLGCDFDNISAFAAGYCHVFPLNEISEGFTDEYYKKIISENAVKKVLLCISQ